MDFVPLDIIEQFLIAFDVEMLYAVWNGCTFYQEQLSTVTDIRVERDFRFSHNVTTSLGRWHNVTLRAQMLPPLSGVA